MQMIDSVLRNVRLDARDIQGFTGSHPDNGASPVGVTDACLLTQITDRTPRCRDHTESSCSYH